VAAGTLLGEISELIPNLTEVKPSIAYPSNQQMTQAFGFMRTGAAERIPHFWEARKSNIVSNTLATQGKKLSEHFVTECTPVFADEAQPVYQTWLPAKAGQIVVTGPEVLSYSRNNQAFCRREIESATATNITFY
jgi:hypothetical protein